MEIAASRDHNHKYNTDAIILLSYAGSGLSLGVAPATPTKRFDTVQWKASPSKEESSATYLVSALDEGHTQLLL